MRQPEALLLDIASAGNRLARYLADLTREQFLADDMVQAATVREIEIIGEACSRLPPWLRSAHGNVPWSDIARLRNLYIHVYEHIRYEREWETATRTIPAFILSIGSLIPTDPGDVERRS